MDPDLQNINEEKIVLYWITTSNEDFDTMQSLFQSKSYHWALFIGHLSIEKLLKALYVKTLHQYPPFIHNLFRLTELCQIKEISDEYADWLDKITTFNLNARYDDYKKAFYHQCTLQFTNEWIEKIKILREWIIQKL